MQTHPDPSDVLYVCRRTNMKLSAQGVVQSGASAAVKVDDKYAFMAKASTTEATGAADAAWDD